MTKSKTNNFIDSFVNIFRKFKILKPLIAIYDKYKEGMLYLFFGALTTFVNIIMYSILAKLFYIDYMVSNAIAWIVSVLFAYVTNKIYVFESSTSTKKELIKEISSFFIARILSLILDIIVMYIGISVLHINDVVVKILSNVLVIIANYFMSKLFVFKNSGENVMKEKVGFVLNIVKKSSVFVLMQIVMILVFTCLLFIFRVSITKFHLPVAIFLNIVAFVILYRKEKKLHTAIAIAIALLVFVFSTFTVGKIYDTTADGNTYHKLAIGAMKNGWNPVYDNIVDFDKDNGNPFDVSENNVNIKWADHYAKGSEIFGATIYKFTNNIESGKSYTILLIFASFGIIWEYLFKSKKMNIFVSFFISFALTINPITIVQIFNYYLDGALALSLFLIFYTNFYIIKKDKLYNEYENFMILLCAIVLCINFKFTGLAFGGIFCLAFYIYNIIFEYKNNKKNWKNSSIKLTIFYILAVVISVCVVGSNSYIKNTINNGHPLYPLYGKGHVDNMVLMEQPATFKDKNNLEIFLISLFSKGVNTSPSYSDGNIQPELKIPFTFSRSEVKNYTIPDIRMARFWTII